MLYQFSHRARLVNWFWESYITFLQCLLHSELLPTTLVLPLPSEGGSVVEIIEDAEGECTLKATPMAVIDYHSPDYSDHPGRLNFK